MTNKEIIDGCKKSNQERLFLTFINFKKNIKYINDYDDAYYIMDGKKILFFVQKEGNIIFFSEDNVCYKFLTTINTFQPPMGFGERINTYNCSKDMKLFFRKYLQHDFFIQLNEKFDIDFNKSVFIATSEGMMLEHQKRARLMSISDFSLKKWLKSLFIKK
jgi:hypothetical protein